MYLLRRNSNLSSSRTAVFSRQHFDDSERVSLLLAVLRLLWSKTGYDEVARAECQPAIDGAFFCLASEDHTVSYPAALVVSFFMFAPCPSSALNNPIRSVASPFCLLRRWS